MTDWWKYLTGQAAMGIAIYLAGILSGEIWDIINERKNEEKLKKNTRIALDAIYSAEKKFRKKPKSGAEKLEYATQELIRQSGIKHYKVAQQIIIQVFGFTKLSK